MAPSPVGQRASGNRSHIGAGLPAPQPLTASLQRQGQPEAIAGTRGDRGQVRPFPTRLACAGRCRPLHGRAVERRCVPGTPCQRPPKTASAFGGRPWTTADSLGQRTTGGQLTWPGPLRQPSSHEETDYSISVQDSTSGHITPAAKQRNPFPLGPRRLPRVLRGRAVRAVVTLMGTRPARFLARVTWPIGQVTRPTDDRPWGELITSNCSIWPCGCELEATRSAGPTPANRRPSGQVTFDRHH
jgi:hypothetical protein